MGRWIRIRYPVSESGIRPNPVGHYPVISGIRYPVKFAIRCIPTLSAWSSGGRLGSGGRLKGLASQIMSLKFGIL